MIINHANAFIICGLYLGYMGFYGMCNVGEQKVCFPAHLTMSIYQYFEEINTAGHGRAGENTGVTRAACVDSLCLWDKTPAKEEWQHLQSPHIWAQAHTLKGVMVRVCPLVTAEMEVSRTAGGDSYLMEDINSWNIMVEYKWDVPLDL